MEKILQNKKWKEFSLQKIGNNDGIFEIKKCKCNCAGDLEDGNDIIYMGAKKDDNGFMKIVGYSEKLVSKGNCIVFICDGEGSVGYSNYMESDFIGSTTLSVGYNKNLTPEIGMFLVTLLDLERCKYSYGRKYGANLSKAVIKLPITEQGEPDRKFMEDYIKSLHSKRITTKNNPGQNKLKIGEWKDFRVGDLFECQTTAFLDINQAEEGDIPYITRSAENNGYSGCFGNIDKVNKGNCITIGAEGGIAFYQPNDFIAGVKVYTLRNQKLNKLNSMFIVTLLNKEFYKYSYGRARILNKICEEIIKLPVTPTGEPDREFMENYIKNLPYGDRI